jgi:hypothetical protein
MNLDIDELFLLFFVGIEMSEDEISNYYFPFSW